MCYKTVLLKYDNCKLETVGINGGIYLRVADLCEMFGIDDSEVYETVFDTENAVVGNTIHVEAVAALLLGKPGTSLDSETFTRRFVWLFVHALPDMRALRISSEELKRLDLPAQARVLVDETTEMLNKLSDVATRMVERVTDQ